jgi:hypothetical protein
VKNLKEQRKRELAAAKSFALQGLARDLLETVDNLARAGKVVNSEAKEDANRHKPFADLLEDLEKVEAQLMGTLMNHGLALIDPEGEKFDPNVHEATFELAMPGKEAGTVFYVEQKGYSLNGRVVRPAKVRLAFSSFSQFWRWVLMISCSLGRDCKGIGVDNGIGKKITPSPHFLDKNLKMPNFGITVHTLSLLPCLMQAAAFFTCSSTSVLGILLLDYFILGDVFLIVIKRLCILHNLPLITILKCIFHIRPFLLPTLAASTALAF